MNNLWAEVFEQTKAKEILEKLIITKRVPHAFIFSGQEGIGKFFTAIQFAKVLYANVGTEKQDYILQSISHLTEPYIKLITPLPRGKNESTDDNAVEKLTKDQIEGLTEELNKLIENPYHNFELENANTIKINSIRDIKRFLSTNFSDIAYRFIIILNAHEMNEQSQNALLKSLEEPPENVIFILITDSLNKLLSTVQSRCWIVDFEPLSQQAVRSILIKYFNIDDRTAELLSLFSEGSVHRALSLKDKNLAKSSDIIIAILRYSIAKRYYSAFLELNRLLEDSSLVEIQFILRLIKLWISDNIKNRLNNNDYFFNNYIETLKKFNEKFRDYDLTSLYDRLDVIDNNCTKNVNLNVISLNIIFELASISIRK
ncbi:MAG: hypothetical protein AB1521_06375 [Bacteroidota bacterium]